MLTYQLQDRILHLDKGNTLTFPGRAEIVVTWGPPELFGAANGTSQVMIPGRNAKIVFHGFTGRQEFQSDPPLEPLQVSVELGSSKVDVNGGLS